MKRFQISTARAQYVRAFIRAATVFAAAFGFRLTVDQIAALYGVTEAALQLIVVERT